MKRIIKKTKSYYILVAFALFFGCIEQHGQSKDENKLAKPVYYRQAEQVQSKTLEIVKADMFADATYEGDLFAAANVSYRVGREPAGAYGESLGGQWQKISWKTTYQFSVTH